jgi:hypothetical protein
VCHAVAFTTSQHSFIVLLLQYCSSGHEAQWRFFKYLPSGSTAPIELGRVADHEGIANLADAEQIKCRVELADAKVKVFSPWQHCK